MLNKKPTRYYSKKQENAIAKSLDGSRQINSGATMFFKGDVTLDNWLIEAKTKVTPSDSHTIKKSWIEKNEEEAFAMGKEHSALAFNFGEEHNAKNWYIISEEDFKKLVEVYKEED